MRVEVNFRDQSLELELPDEQLVAAWGGPSGKAPEAPAEMVRAALEASRDYPSLRQSIVPGDRVAIALDPETPDLGTVVATIAETLRMAGVDGESLTVLLPSKGGPELVGALPPGATLAVHDPDDRAQLAYLATTKEGRRIYLNKHLADADFVLPVGRIGFDAILGYRGPWSALFPALSDREALRINASRFRVDDDAHQEKRTRANRGESLEVSWLVGSQLHVGVIAGTSGILDVISGRDSSVCDRGIAVLDEHWTFRPESRAEIVVAGLGRPDARPSLESLAEGLATATRLVQNGGKIIILSNATGAVGPALRYLIDAGGAERGESLLRGREMDDDFQVASRIAQAVAWADVFLYSELPRDLVEELSMTPIEKPEQARRLLAQGRSATILSLADWTRACVRDEEY